MTAEQNRQLLEMMDAHRHFLLLACRDTPELLQTADQRIRDLLIPDLAARRFEMGERTHGGDPGVPGDNTERSRISADDVADASAVISAL